MGFHVLTAKSVPLVTIAHKGCQTESRPLDCALREGAPVPKRASRPRRVRPDHLMPIAFKEWAVTVRALSEGEQLVALRKGGIREENKHFEVEHDQFFLYPTFDHQRNDLVRESHHPELRRALEEGVWP